MLQLRNIVKTYQSNNGKTTKALDGISLDFDAGQMVFVVGKSGCGKSTLLNLIGGLDVYDSGEIIVDGVSTKHFSSVDYDYYRNKYIGFVFQEYNLLEEDNIYTNISLAQKLQRNSAGKEKIDELLTTMGIEGYGDRLPPELSGGERQRAAIARALIKSPDIILADEPTGALDEESGRQILDILKKISAEKLVIVVSHDREYAEKYADRIIELRDGRIINDTAESTAMDISNDVTTVDNIESTTPKVKAHDKNGAGFAVKGTNLPWTEACKIGISGLKKRKLRLLAAIFLAAVSIFLFGICTTLFVYNRNKTILNSMYDSDLSVITVRKLVKVKLNNGFSTSYANLSDDDIDILRKNTGNTIAPVLEIYIGDIMNYIAKFKESNDIFTFPKTMGAMEMDASLAKKFGYTLLSGRYPENNREILVSNYLYLNFEYFGHRDPITDIKTEIKNHDDLLGKSFGNALIDRLTGAFTIVGVLDNGLDITRYQQPPDDEQESALYSGSLPNLINDLRAYGYDYIYLNPGHYAARGEISDNATQSDADYACVAMALVGKMQKDIKLLNYIDAQSNHSTEEYEKFTFDNTIKNYVMSMEKHLKSLSWISLGVGALMALFAGVMIFNYFVISISDKKREIGILRALGASKKDIFNIFMSRGFVIALINAALGIILTISGIALINFVLKTQFDIAVTILSFGILSAVSIVIISLLTMFLGSIIPIRHISGQSPADAIKNT